MEKYETILLEKKEGIAVITLNLPEVLNALEVRLERELLKALKDCGQDEEVRAVVLTGAGRAFSSGGDIKKMEKGLQIFEAKSWVEDGGNLADAIATMPKPIIAAVNGPAVGGGVNVALFCDFVIASEKAYFSEIFSQVGLIPDAGGHWILPRLVGYRRAIELIFTAEKIDAQRALELGLINKVVSHEDLMEESLSLAKKLAKGPTRAFGLTKAILRKSFSSDLREILEMEELAQSLTFVSEDHREGVRAFREKRLPDFRGK
jgi:2-(1,2-epoxy-1,2-dihydrophenyl)acetyl-CoA isomerase